MNTKLSIKMIIGLILIGLMGIPACARREEEAKQIRESDSISNSSKASDHYQEGWKYLTSGTIIQTVKGEKDIQKDMAERNVQIEKAITEFQKAVDLGPENTIFHKSLACAYDKRGETEKAEHQYKEAIRLAPEDSYLHFALGRLYAKDESSFSG